MREFISISRLTFVVGVGAILLGSSTLSPPLAFAEDAKPQSKTEQPEEEDHASTPYTEYGEFNEEADEEADTRFFKFGRFFGVAAGLGYEGVTGNRGSLWRGGFPLVDFKVHYWFDFQVALQLGFSVVNHYYSVSASDQFEVNLYHIGADIKYYFDTRNLAAAISFANPSVLVGFGPFTKIETDSDGTSDQNTAWGLTVGGALEFPIKPRKIYFSVEPKFHVVRFSDILDQKGSLPDLTGYFFTVTGSVIFTW